MIGTNGERDSGKSVVAAQLDDDDDDYVYMSSSSSSCNIYIYIYIYIRYSSIQ